MVAVKESFANQIQKKHKRQKHHTVIQDPAGFLDEYPLLFLIKFEHHAYLCCVTFVDCKLPLSSTLLQIGRSCRRCLHSFGLAWRFPSQDQDHQAAAYRENVGMLLNHLQKTPSLHLCCLKRKQRRLKCVWVKKSGHLDESLRISWEIWVHSCIVFLFLEELAEVLGGLELKTISLILKNLLQFASPELSSSVYFFSYHKCKPS